MITLQATYGMWYRTVQSQNELLIELINSIVGIFIDGLFVKNISLPPGPTRTFLQSMRFCNYGVLANV